MKFLMTKWHLPVIAFLIIGLAGCGSMQKTGDELVADSRDAKSSIEQNYPQFSDLFETSAGYAIFPNVGKGAYIIGGASGNGTVYENGTMIGYANLKELDVGLQAGGKSFIEVIFFENQQALNDFKDGSYELSANASAVILEEGISRDIDFQDGVAVLTMPKAGAMAGISVGGQRFDFYPAE